MAHVYVVQFNTGAVKVGKAVDPKRRIASHRTDGGAFGAGIAQTWVSPAHDNYGHSERLLLTFCRDRWTQSRAEYFPGADFDEVTRYARSLNFCQSKDWQTTLPGWPVPADANSDWDDRVEPATAAIAAALGIEEGAHVRVRWTLLKMAGRTVGESTSYIPDVLVHGRSLPAPDTDPTGADAIFVLVASGVNPTRAVEKVSARMPSAEEADRLEVLGIDPLLVVRRHIFAGNRVVEVTDSAHHGSSTVMENSIDLTR